MKHEGTKDEKQNFKKVKCKGVMCAQEKSDAFVNK